MLVAALGPSQDDPEVALALYQAYQSTSDPLIRGQVVVELAGNEEPGSRALLQTAMQDASVDVRVRAVFALGANRENQTQLRAAYADPDQSQEVRAGSSPPSPEPQPSTSA